MDGRFKLTASVLARKSSGTLFFSEQVGRTLVRSAARTELARQTNPGSSCSFATTCSPPSAFQLRRATMRNLGIFMPPSRFRSNPPPLPARTERAVRNENCFTTRQRVLHPLLPSPTLAAPHPPLSPPTYVCPPPRLGQLPAPAENPPDKIFFSHYK